MVWGGKEEKGEKRKRELVLVNYSPPTTCFYKSRPFPEKVCQPLMERMLKEMGAKVEMNY